MSNPTVPHLYLASQSPRRGQLLSQIGVPHRQINVSVDETPAANEQPVDYVERVTLAKLLAGHALVPDELVLAADTAVVLGDRILGKPRDKADAVAMLLALSGTTHQVLTGVGVVHDTPRYRLNVNKVKFRAISVKEAHAYWDTGEPADKAGGYAIQGMGALFVETMEGSYTGVMGLPLFETAQLLQPYGLAILVHANAGIKSTS